MDARSVVLSIAASQTIYIHIFYSCHFFSYLDLVVPKDEPYVSCTCLEATICRIVAVECYATPEKTKIPNEDSVVSQRRANKVPAIKVFDRALKPLFPKDISDACPPSRHQWVKYPRVDIRWHAPAYLF